MWTSTLALCPLRRYSKRREVTTLDRDYDIVEKLPDASMRVLIRVHGTRHVPNILEARGKETTNECFARDIRTGKIIARVNDKSTPSKLTKLANTRHGQQWPGQLPPLIGE